MSAGTISIQNNAAAVAGTGTAFTTELSAGDFIVITTGGVTYTLPVKSIESDTALTLARSYNGPAVTGAAWTAMPRDTLNRISAQIAADTAYAIRQRVLEIDNWYQLLEVNGDVTIKMADGSSYTGPSWLKLIDVMKEMKIDELIPIAEQIRADAQQVADDKPVIVQAKDDALAAAAAAAASEGNAATSESNAATSASTASTKADEAAESARQAGASNPQLALQKSLNLADLEDRDEAWMNVRPDGPTPLAADPVDDDHAATKGWVEKFITSVRSVLASWSVINQDASIPPDGTNVSGGKVISKYKGGTLEVSAAFSVTHNTTEQTTGVTRASFTVTDKNGVTKQCDLDSLGNFGIPNTYFGANIIMNPPNDVGVVNIFRRDAFGGSTRFGGAIELRFNRINAGYDFYPQQDGDGSLHVFERILNNDNVAIATYAKHSDGSYTAYNGSFINGSDIHIKYDVERIENALKLMPQINGCTWRLKANDNFGIGFIAQDVEKIFPEAVRDSYCPQTFSDGTSVERVKALSAGDVAAALHHESILQLMDIVKNALMTIAGVTTDESAKAALEALAEKIPASE
ncbi:tail fiber domain-containing protein [Kluyvera sp.]